jgi:AcrR family transcriptional regulator
MTNQPAGSTGGEAAAPRDRLTRDERRDHLLDVAATLVLAGEAPLSMEGMARAAGVSKTLPYKHFDNIGAVLTELYQRETRRMAYMVWEQLQQAGPDDDLTRVWVRAFFDAVASHGAVIRSMSMPGSASATVSDTASYGPEAVAIVLREVLGTDPQRAGEVSRMVYGGMVGAAISWQNGEASRDELEDLLVAHIRAATGYRQPAD